MAEWLMSRTLALWARKMSFSNYNWRQNELRHFCPKLGFFYVLLTSKGGNIAFPPPFPPCNVVLMFELPTENNKHPNFE